jgi:hypothetical protein
MRFWRSPVGWVFVALYVGIFVVAYLDYLRYRGTWMADLGLVVLVMPYIFVGRLVTLDPSFDLHGSQPWGFVPAVLFCILLAYCLGAGLQSGIAIVRRRVFPPAERDDSD